MWLLLAIGSYILQAINGAIDRVIVHRNKTSPEIVSFWIALFSLSTVGLLLVGFLPFDWANNFDFIAPDQNILFLVLLAGLMTQAGLLYMYRALEDGEATRVLSVMGAVTPVVALIYGYFAIDELLSGSAWIAFILLIFGAVMLTYKKHSESTYEWVYFAIVSSTILGIQSIVAKFVYDNYHFISAYSLMSLGSVLFAVYLFTKSKVRDELKAPAKNSSGKSSLPLIIFNTVIGGLAVIIFNLAIKLGSPSLVNALRGVQYAFVFVIALLLANKYPMLLDEDLSRKTIFAKISGIILIISGIAFLAI